MSFSRPVIKSDKETSASANTKVLSIDVITEARKWTARSSAKTSRPMTPKDLKMTLFSDRTSSNSRPPSAFSLGCHHFDPNDNELMPNPVKLAPLPSVPVMPSNPEPVMSKPTLSFSQKNATPNRSAVEPYVQRKKLPMKAFSPGHDMFLDKAKTGDGGNGFNRRSQVASAPCDTNVKSSLFPPDKVMEPDIASPLKPLSASSVNMLTIKPHAVGDPIQMRQNVEKIASQKRSNDPMTSSEEESIDQAKYWNQNILPLLERLEESDQQEEDAFKVCLRLHTALLTGDCIWNLSARRRTSLLSTLFKQLNRASCRVHLACAKTILEVRVRKQNLNSVCKMLFKISREKKSDEIFVEIGLIESMLRLASQFTDPLDNYESFVYLSGAVKFLCSNKKVAGGFATKGCVLSFTKLLSNTMDALKKRKYMRKEKLHATDIIIQITAVLRTMTDLDRPKFVGSGLFFALLQALDILQGDEVLVLNVSRLLSKLTMYSDLQAEFLMCSDWPCIMLNMMCAYKHSINILVRLCFALGNLTAKEERARVALYRAASHGDVNGAGSATCTEIFSDLIDTYLNLFVLSPTEGAGEILDLINKAIRVLANMSISEQLGGEIASNPSCVANILRLLEKVGVSDSEELIVNTLTALNNLSYYSPESSVVLQKRMEIATLLLDIIIADNMSCVMEVTRVFGNISQYADVRELLHKNQIDSMMVALLDSGKWQMVHSACGVLINMTACDRHKQHLVREKIILKLIDVLKDFAPMEWRVGGVACQLLWNLCECADSVALVISSEDSTVLVEILHAYLAENAPLQMLDTSSLNKDMLEYILDVWQTEFCPVAQRLMKKICTCHSQLVPLESEEISGV